MSGRRMWGLGGKRLSSDGGRVRYSSCRPASQDDLEDIAVVFHADPGQVKYGSGPITANGPRVIPGIIRTQRSVSGGRLNTGSPLYLDKTSPAPVPSAPLKGKSLSRQSLIDVFSSRISIGSRKRFSRDSFSASYVNRTQVASELDVSKKTREARRKKIKNFKVDKWESSTSSSDRRQGCRWTFVFDPAGRLCYYWSLIVSLAFLYNLWVMVYRFAFQEITGESILVWFALDYFADLIYVVDILFHFRTGYLEDGVLQTDSRKLRQHYMNSTTFYVDCLCLLPLDILYLSIGFKSILRCFRLVKIYKYWHFLDRTERHTNSPNLFRSVSLIHYLLVIFHWNACLFHIIARNDGFTFRPHFLSTNGADGVVLEYLRVFYWCTLSLTTIGGSPLHDATPPAPPPLHHSPGTSPTATASQDSHNGTQDAPTAAAAAALNSRTKTDYLYNIAQLMFGLLLFATVLGHIANIVTNVSAARKEFQAKLDGVKTYMRMRRVPAHLQAKVIKWFDYLWLTQKCSDEERAVSCLPDKLKAEMAIHVHLDTLKRVEIFQNTEAGFLCELVLHLRPVLFSPGDYICRKGEVGKEMYIVNRGRLQVVADNGKTMLATLKAGSYFGEISILNMGTAGNRRTASVRSVGYSDLFVLSKKDMWDVLKEYPAARVRLEAIAAKRLEKYKKAPLEKAAMGRSSSTPGLVESSGRVPLEEMWLPPILKPPQHPPCTPVFTPSTSPRTQTHRSQTLESERLTMESGLSDASSRQSTDDEVHRPIPPQQPPHHHPLYHPQPPSQPPPTQPPLPPSSSSSSQPIGILQGSHSAGALPRDSSPQELLLGEIRRLRERLVSLEAENASMTLRLSQQQWQVEHRLHEIELQLCPNSSTASSGDDSERNRESII